MSRITILPEILSNKIAAGEVVERPASVVKELIENAIDAGSTSITVKVERGGRSLIQVADNGTGMTRDDALLCLERYATSKLVDEADLFSISTLGFRGEALPSIASVSDFSLITRPASDEAGTEIIVSGGKIRDVRAAGAPAGTMVEVRRLFFNTPARRKFLKAEATEMGHIADITAAFALCRHDIHFQLQHNGQTVKNWPRAAEPSARIADVLGRETGQGLRPVNFSDDHLTISGWISSPRVTRRTSKRIYLFVNGRIVHDRGLRYALFEGYRGRIVKGTFPVAALFLKVPFDRVDVNVHPTKSEVKFADQRRIYNCLQQAVAAVWSAQTTPPRTPAGDGPPVPDRDPAARMPGVAERISSYPGRQTSLELDTDPPPWQEAPPRPPASETSGRTEPGESGQAPDNPPGEIPSPEAPNNHFFSDLTVIGQLHDSYIVAATDQDLILIDQHAAHERVVFERLKSRARRQKPASQGLLIPETVELTYQEAAALESLLEEFSRLGLIIETFGGNTFVVKAVPDILAEVEAAPLVEELAARLAESGLAPDLASKIDDCLHVMACHSAVRANQRLSEQETRSLLARLDECDNPWHCPHGRPTSINWPRGEIERSFKRIV
ncbi:MAG: DNA mismatch repair endonuclease MutL [Desulfosudaceae bacterium]